MHRLLPLCLCYVHACLRARDVGQECGSCLKE
jgi:hypothetical protein